jgi:hypothetical protein
VGVEHFDDGSTHGSVFAVTADGNATRLACDPSPRYPLFRAQAITPDGIYVSVFYGDPPGSWDLIKVSHP